MKGTTPQIGSLISVTATGCHGLGVKAALVPFSFDRISWPLYQSVPSLSACFAVLHAVVVTFLMPLAASALRNKFLRWGLFD